ncbi:hypothetical protein M2163_000532 [Streptomyces sp. SAI-135]|nr:hypothetical protein [Streptomyces sp. SAI-090]MDH6554582.1 hypothetical protein [Streptomyces sp. SAI-041]MDH6581420.1 hypothetical protein [Streptomyces sp. SAI-133]MDH6613424.1 hypothetical protein [Streptomyces sp. SAI-135]
MSGRRGRPTTTAAAGILSNSGVREDHGLHAFCWVLPETNWSRSSRPRYSTTSASVRSPVSGAHGAAPPSEQRPHLADGTRDSGTVHADSAGQHVMSGAMAQTHHGQQSVDEDELVLRSGAQQPIASAGPSNVPGAVCAKGPTSAPGSAITSGDNPVTRYSATTNSCSQPPWRFNELLVHRATVTVHPRLLVSPIVLHGRPRCRAPLPRACPAHGKRAPTDGQNGDGAEDEGDGGAVRGLFGG